MTPESACTVGLDFGTNSVRAVVVRCADGAELGAHIHPYPSGESGVVGDPAEPELARQHPADHLEGLAAAVQGALAAARASESAFEPAQVTGIGVAATGSTPLPLDAKGQPLALDRDFAGNPHAMAWLWKDHTATAEAAALTRRAADAPARYLEKCGGAYSSEWFWAKAWHCAAVAPAVAAATATWAELSDWIPAVLTGADARFPRNACAAGHKALHHPDWGGYPPREFLAALHPDLGRWRDALEGLVVAPIDRPAGRLSGDWAVRLGLPAGVTVGTGALDAHLGAVGAGVRPGRMIKILGTSTCDILVAPAAVHHPFVPGLSGVATDSVLPGHVGIEAGQAAVGDLFNWWQQRIGPQGAGHAELTAEAARLRPGESGVVALDWNNGNRCVLADQRLSGLLVGQTLATRPGDVYRALIEATAFGARVILERLQEYQVPVHEVVGCGGLAEHNSLLMQIYADVLGRPMHMARSGQTSALGAAIGAAVAAGVFPDVPAAQSAMTGLRSQSFSPNPQAVAIYDRLFRLYRALHDAFGPPTRSGDALGHVMRDLRQIRASART